MSNSIANHVTNVIAKMTLREQVKDLFQEILDEMFKPSCYRCLRHPQMYTENDCCYCEWLEQCDKESGKR